MQKKLYFIFLFFIVSGLAIAQQTQTIQLQSNTSGYLESQSSSKSSTQNSANRTSEEVVPTIKGELNVNAQGALTYNVPIEVFKGINNFQPNLALAYSSDGSNGQAGYGWNLVGLSVITQGGKSKRIDNVYVGPQFDDNDPYYLDGQRLIQVGSSTDYQTELYSHIRVERINSGDYTFMVQYPDGKVAKYQQVTNGQHSIALMEDAFGNQIQYNYTISDNTPYIDTIEYGKTTGSHPFTVAFVRGNRNQPVKVWRNGISYINSEFINEIHVSSEQEGLYRKYVLTHDITSLGQERLRIVNVENGQGDSLKPLEFSYNTSDGRTIEFTPNQGNPGIPSDSEKIGGVTVGDFYGNGDISSVYWVSRGGGNPNKLVSSKNGVISTNESTYQPSLYTGKIIQANGKFGERDQLIEFSSELLDDDVFQDGLYFPKTRVTIKSRDLETGEINETSLILRGSYRIFEECDIIDYGWDYDEECYDELTRIKRIGSRYVSDFNKDGLVDILIAQTSMKGSPVSNPDENTTFQTSPSRTIFIEIGKYLNFLSNGGQVDYQVFEGAAMPSGQIIEFDGDGIPEILEVNKTTQEINIYKLNFSNNTITKPLIDYPLTDDVTKDTPLIFGDFNGDGLTDFITPKKVFKIDKDNGITAQDVVNDIETSSLIWYQYINEGNTFTRKTRNFTNAKLAYCAPASSYHHIKIHRSSFWQKLWSGTPDRAEYITSDFGASTVIPIDFNNDGKTDLATFKKFGRIKFEGKKVMNASNLNNLNLTVYESLGIDEECFDNCFYDCIDGGYGGSNSSCNNYCESECEIVNTSPSQIVNHVVFHENIFNEDNEFSFLSHDGEESVPIGDIKMSPYSFFINSQQSNGLNSYQNKLVLYDPYTKKNHTFEINSDEFRENRLEQINNNSGVVQSIQYAPLQRLIKNESAYYTTYSENKFYKYDPEAFNEPYPFYIHKQVPLKTIVARINTLFDGQSLTKEYRYQNAIQHLDGQGFLGFQKTLISDVYESTLMLTGEYFPKNLRYSAFWTINTYDPTIQNQLVKTTYGGQEEYFTESNMSYQRFDESNNRYLYHNTSETSIDHLKNITISKTHNYNGDLLLESTTTQYGSVGSSIASYEYQPSWSSGEHFYHGKIKTIENTTNAYGDSFTSRDEYFNFNDAGIPLTHEKYGNGTEAITTTTAYDSYGNKTSEIISASDVSPLTTTYDYDSSKRFVTDITDPEGLTATSAVNMYGWIEEETSALGLTTTHTYDNWGNPLTSTDYLDNTTTLEKEQLSNGRYSLSTITPDTPQTIIIFDRFDRQVQTKTQSINNKWVVVDTEYDIYGRKIKQSEPYFDGGAATLWNAIEYDQLDRPILQTMYNGKVITTCYQGLTVTVEDDEQKTTKRLDAMGNTVYHKDFGGTINYSYYANGTLKEANYDNIKIKVEQDGWGNKTKLDDPSAGIYQYEYDALGRKLKEITPKGETIYVYDEFGKLLYENTVGDYTDISVQYEYDTTTKLPIRIIGNNGSDSFVYETFYDEYFRINGKKETHPQFTYETHTIFNPSTGKADVISTETTLNTGETVNTAVKNNYDSAGILTQLTNNLTGQVLWTINDVNPKGLTTQMVYGNEYQVSNSYNQYYLPENITHEHNGNEETALNIDYDFDDVKGLLLYRNNTIFNKNETFEYDALHRLTTENLNGNLVNQYTYDKRGRITHNTEIGKYQYGSNNYQITKLQLNADGKQLKDDRGFANVTYNSYKKAVNIHLENTERINFVYNLFKDRTAMYYGSEDEDKMVRPYRKYYSSDKAVEIKHDVTNNTWQVITYLDGDPYSANVLQKNTFVSDGGTLQEIYYLHRDYQATILAISNENGDILEKRFFDAWGNLNEAWNIHDGDTDAIVLLDRGYTGHEHLQSVGLIHMNGRLYDAKLRRFLSPDNFVQNPYNTQNYNRYQYGFNNPLLYADPSGEILGITLLTVGKLLMGAAIGAAVGITMNAIMNLSNGNPWWYGAGKAGVIGAVSGAISLYIGEAASTFFSGNQILFQAGAHGTLGGGMSAIEGGNFVSGFAAGAISSLVGSGAQGLGIKGKDLKNVITIASGGLSGGISSTIAGGNFWSGARQGLITSGLNHVAHNVATLGKSKLKPLSDHKNDLNKVFDDRIIDINKDIAENQTKINDPNSRKGQIRRATRQNNDLNMQKTTVNIAKGKLNYLLNKSHGYSLSTTTSGVPSGTKGTLKWGNNNKSIIITFNGGIRVLAHEMSHAYDVVKGTYSTTGFKAGARIKVLGYGSEIDAWKITYSLRNNDASVSSLLNINTNFVKGMGF